MIGKRVGLAGVLVVLLAGVLPSAAGAQRPPSHPPACQIHQVPYTAEGTLVSQVLGANVNGTFSGTVTIDVSHASWPVFPVPMLPPVPVHPENVQVITYTVADANVVFQTKGAMEDCRGPE